MKKLKTILTFLDNVRQHVSTLKSQFSENLSECKSYIKGFNEIFHSLRDRLKKIKLCFSNFQNNHPSYESILHFHVHFKHKHDGTKLSIMLSI